MPPPEVKLVVEDSDVLDEDGVNCRSFVAARSDECCCEGSHMKYDERGRLEELAVGAW